MQINNDGKFRIASDKNTSPDVLANLARTETAEDILTAVAENINTPSEVLLEMVQRQEQNVYVRQALARNDSTPAEAIAILLNDVNRYVHQEAYKRSPMSTKLNMFLAANRVTLEEVEEIIKEEKKKPRL